MAYELRMLKGDTYDVVVSVTDRNGAVVDITGGGWNVALESDTINKNSVDNPADFAIETAPYVMGQVAVNISCLETQVQTSCRKHFKIKLYQDTNPPLVKTVASGDFFFVDEV